MTDSKPVFSGPPTPEEFQRRMAEFMQQHFAGARAFPGAAAAAAGAPAFSAGEAGAAGCGPAGAALVSARAAGGALVGVSSGAGAAPAAQTPAVKPANNNRW